LWRYRLVLITVSVFISTVLTESASISVLNSVAFLNSAFDREEEDYDLEVSSPGLDMPLKVKEQYQKNLNKEISIVLVDGKKHKGVLTAFDDDGIEAEVKVKVKADNQKKKKEIIEKQIFKFNDIKAVKPVVSFK
jgi:ribosome maturation factor RimP